MKDYVDWFNRHIVRSYEYKVFVQSSPSLAKVKSIDELPKQFLESLASGDKDALRCLPSDMSLIKELFQYLSKYKNLKDVVKVFSDNFGWGEVRERSPTDDAPRRRTERRKQSLSPRGQPIPSLGGGPAPRSDVQSNQQRGRQNESIDVRTGLPSQEESFRRSKHEERSSSSQRMKAGSHFSTAKVAFA